MTAAGFIKILVSITLIEMMVAIGLGVGLAELTSAARNWRLATKAALANYLCVPAVTVSLLLLFHPADAMVPAGFLILAVCPGAPFGPGCTRLARGNAATAVGLMVLLAGSSAIAAPVLLHFLLPLMSRSETLHVDARQIVMTLLATQLAPLCVGLGVRHGLPRLANRLQKPANLVSAILSLATFGVVLVVYFPLLAEIQLRGYVGMLALLVASWAAGWLLGGPGSDNRRALALTTSLRNVGVGLVIATGNFGGTAAVTAVLAYGIFEIVGSLFLALAWGQVHPDPRRMTSIN
ncbi:MAG TPA: bile acid:sodium symporter [Pirellulales bacterium]|nr:bile acid:sodium symporter [Pirellulales bacterium]